MATKIHGRRIGGLVVGIRKKMFKNNYLSVVKQ